MVRAALNDINKLISPLSNAYNVFCAYSVSALVEFFPRLQRFRRRTLLKKSPNMTKKTEFNAIFFANTLASEKVLKILKHLFWGLRDDIIGPR